MSTESEPENPDLAKRPDTEPRIPEAANDGFPLEKDVSDPPPDSDVKSGENKEDEG